MKLAVITATKTERLTIDRKHRENTVALPLQYYGTLLAQPRCGYCFDSQPLSGPLEGHPNKRRANSCAEVTLPIEFAMMSCTKRPGPDSGLVRVSESEASLLPLHLVHRDVR